MLYKLVFDKEVSDFLEKLPKKISTRIFKKLLKSKSNPHRYFIRLKNRSEYKLRVGDYRIIADIEDDQLIIYLIYADHRNRIYKRI